MSMAENGQIPVAPFQGGALKVSKLRVFSLNVPILYSFSFGGGFGFTLGPVVNLNTGSSIVNKFSLDGDKMKDKYKRVHCNIITVDAMFQIECTLLRREPTRERWKGYYMANTNKWYFAYSIDGDTITIVDACHAQNMH